MITPVLDRIFVQLEADNKALGGIILPDDFRHSRNVGVVQSVGPQVTSVVVGDKVLVHVFDELPTPDPDVVVVRENSVLGVFENE